MPLLIDRQREIYDAELGRIRLGQKVTKVARSGNEYTAPEKLKVFRFTSPFKHMIEALAKMYGGTVEPCDPTSQLAGQWEVVTESSTIACVLTLDWKNTDKDDPAPEVSQWMEFYNQRDGCIRRCNQVRMVNPASPTCSHSFPSNPNKGEAMRPDESECLCARLRAEAEAGGAPFDEKKQGCKAISRLSVSLLGVPGFGTWRIDTKGAFAKNELPNMVKDIKGTLINEQSEFPWVPVTITADFRKDKIVDEHGKSQDVEFVVPVINVPFGRIDAMLGQVKNRILEFAQSLALPSSNMAVLTSGMSIVPALTQSNDMTDEIVEQVEAHVVDDEPAAAQVVTEEAMTPVKAYAILGVTADNVGDLKAALKQTGVDVGFGDFAKVQAESGIKGPDEFLEVIKRLNPSAFEATPVEPVAAPNPPPGDPDHDPFAVKVEQEGLGGLV